LAFMDTVRSTEKAVAAGRRGQDIRGALDVAPLGAITEEEWRDHWPQVTDQSPAAREGSLAASDESLDQPAAAVDDITESGRADETAEASAGETPAPAVAEGEIASEASAQ
jgi:XTP/dITP diphosphohydrolase